MRVFLFCVTLAFSGLTFAQVLPVAPRTADRDLQQLHQDFDRYLIEEEISSLRQNALPAEKTVPRNEASQMNATFEFNNFIKLKSCLCSHYLFRALFFQ